MFVVRILNKLMYKTREDDNGSHLYLGKFDKNGNAILKQMTHMYKPDQKRFMQADKGILNIRKVSKFNVPQGIFVKNITKDRKGNIIDKNYIKKNCWMIYDNVRVTKITKNKKR